MSELRDLYQEVILDHNKRPRNFGALEPADRRAIGHNPLCGDKLTVYVRLDGTRVADVRFEGQGCAISKASASMMTEMVKGLSRDDIAALFESFHHLVTAPDAGDEGDHLGKLTVFAGVREYPTRVKCATLSWHTLRAALEDEAPQPVTTE
ncbi:MAG: SUF system NifU family Fe-S cluster assembly protein [Luteitalea sp.]|nr:SUF system NifU family Fe-S cluster assembly protein [Luteitalea sp.]